MSGILEGVKVIDMGHFVAVPFAGAMLADWGAEVIKVEPPSGELLRGVKAGQGISRIVKVNGEEVHWGIQLANRNKKGLAVNLKTKPGREIIYKLARKSDVFISNYELHSLENLKMDYSILSRVNPGLVYGVLTGYGTAGPDKDQRGFDYAAAWARTGVQYMTGEPGSPPPPQRPALMDIVASTHIVAGILAALLHKQKTGEGQKLEFSLFHSGVWTACQDIQATIMGLSAVKHNRTRTSGAMWNAYRTRDDRWVQLTMHSTEAYWSAFCQAIERPDLKDDPRFNSMEGLTQHCEELIRILDEVLATRDLAEWEKRLKKYHCIYDRIQTPAEVITDPQAVANGFFAEVAHPAAGKLKMITSPVKFVQNPASLKTPAPEVGQHTEEILLDLGYTWDDITRLKEQQVIP